MKWGGGDAGVRNGKDGFGGSERSFDFSGSLGLICYWGLFVFGG